MTLQNNMTMKYRYEEICRRNRPRMQFGIVFLQLKTIRHELSFNNFKSQSKQCNMTDVWCPISVGRYIDKEKVSDGEHVDRSWHKTIHNPHPIWYNLCWTFQGICLRPFALKFYNWNFLASPSISGIIKRRLKESFRVKVFFSNSLFESSEWCLHFRIDQRTKEPISARTLISPISYMFQCNKKRIVDYPNVWGYLRDVYQIPGIKETVNQEHIQKGYQVKYSAFAMQSCGVTVHSHWQRQRPIPRPIQMACIELCGDGHTASKHQCHWYYNHSISLSKSEKKAKHPIRQNRS